MLLQKTVVSEILISVPGAGSSVYHHKKGKCIAFTEYRIMLFAVEELVVAVFWFNHRVPVVFRKFSVGFHITIKVKTATENKNRTNYKKECKNEFFHLKFST